MPEIDVTEHTSNHRVVFTSEVVLPTHGTLRRRSPRPPELQQSYYQDLFDSQTVFCDVFQSDGSVIMVGPPLLNLQDIFLSARYRIDGQSAGGPRTFELNRAQRTELDALAADDLTVEYGEYSAQVRIRSAMNDLFSERTVLVAMQRNNPLKWVTEWVRLYAEANGVDAVILYDLRSTHYSTQELSAAIAAVPGIHCSVVVHWPFKYGVKPSRQGDPWDSDYGQYVAWEHARHRFLGKARAVTVSDLDEVFLAEDGRSIFEHAAESPTGIVRFRQRFIEPVVTSSPRSDTSVSFANYLHYDPSRPLSTPKYAVIMDKMGERNQFLVHTIAHDYTPETDAIIGRQFEAMKLAWDRGSFDRKHPDVSLERSGRNLVVDQVLSAVLERVQNLK